MTDTLGTRPSARGAWTLAVLATAVYAAAFVVVDVRYDHDIAGGLVVGPVMAVVGLAILPRLLSSEPDTFVRRLIAVSYGLKIVSAVAIYFITFGVYGRGDAVRYDRAGEVYASQIWNGNFVPDVDHLVGTNFMEVVAGWVYAAISPTRLGGFIVFALLGWVGLYLCYLAFRLAVPNGNRRWYALLLMLLPSMLFWPSTIGKEAWMMFTLGMASHGVARWFASRRGLLLLGIGLLGMSMVRPHMAVFVFLALSGAVLFSSGREAEGSRPGGRLVMLVLLVAVGPLLASQTQQFLNVDSLTVGTVDQVLQDISGRTSIGGSSFSNSLVQDPLDVPIAFVSVLMRPFPWETGGPLQLLASLEGIALAVIVWQRRGALRRLPAAMRRSPYVAYAAIYTLLFVIGFSSFNNLGLLARERTQVFPFLLVCICIAAVSGRRTEKVDEPPAAALPQPAEAR